MYGIRVRNTGIWGYTTWCTRDGKVELYATRAEAEKVAQEYNDQQAYQRSDNWKYRSCHAPPCQPSAKRDGPICRG